MSVRTRFLVASSEGRHMEIEAVDWMMALVRATDLMGARVAGFSCDTREDGGVDVTDHDTGQSWRVTPLEGAATSPPHATSELALSTTPGPVGRAMMRPRTREYRTVPRKPLWSPESTPRKGPEPRGALDQPPPNLAERLFELSLEIQGSTTADAASRKALDIVTGLVPGEAGSVLRGGRDDDALVFVAATGPAAASLMGRKLPYGEGIAGAACVAGVTIQVVDVSRDPRHHAGIDAVTGFRTRNILCVPVRTETGFFGVIEVLNATDPSGFLAWHVDVVESVALALATTLAGEPPSAIEPLAT